jgi:hypothetical protein
MPREKTKGTSSSGGVAPREPRFPYTRAFVVQFAEHAEPSGGEFEGRVEHLHSGRRAPFESGEALVTLLTGMLLHPDSDPGDPGEAPPGKPRGRKSGRPRDTALERSRTK